MGRLALGRTALDGLPRRGGPEARISLLRRRGRRIVGTRGCLGGRQSGNSEPTCRRLRNCRGAPRSLGPTRACERQTTARIGTFARRHADPGNRRRPLPAVPRQRCGCCSVPAPRSAVGCCSSGGVARHPRNRRVAPVPRGCRMAEPRRAPNLHCAIVAERSGKARQQASATRGAGSELLPPLLREE